MEPIPAGPASLVGSTCGPYRILEELGAGAMGTVYLAEPEGGPDGDEPARVALKLLHPHLMRRKGFFTRFRREAEAGRQVEHQNVVRTFDCDLLLVGGQLCFFLVMEYAEGQTLRELLGELGRVPPGLLREIALQTSAGLAAIHAEDLVHRDLKPENVLLARDQRVRIMDLGIAKVFDTSIAITHEGSFAGSLLYVAPEQIRQEDVGPAADLYSLGVVLYELATGRNPFEAESAAGVIYRHLHHDPEPPADLSPFFSAVVTNLLAKSPSERVRSAAALHRTLLEAEKSAWWEERREDAEWRAERGVKIPVRRGTRVYGRDRERKALGRGLERARGGAGAMVLLEGEAGIGKTRLVDVFAQAAAREGATVFYGSFGAGHALVDAVSERFGERLEAELEWLLQDTPALLPAFVALLRHEPPPPASTPLEGGARDAVWCGLVRALARDRPVVWIAEDLQFAAQEDRRVLRAMFRATARDRVLLLASTRAPLPPDELAELARSDGFHRVALRRLDRAAVQRLLHDAFRNKELADKLGGRIHEKSDGVPFFVVEMIRGLADRKFLAPAGDGRFVESRAIGRIEVPSAVRDLIEARLSDLAPGERTILDAGAVQGFEFDPEITADVLGLEKVTVLQKIALLERRLGVVGERERTCRFDHHLIQEVLYEGMLPSLRAAYHARVGEALARSGAAPEGIARHLLLGDAPERAGRFLLEALDQLGREYRNDARVELADLALPHVGGELRVRTLLGKAEALFVLGDRPRRLETLREALRDAGDRARLDVLLELAREGTSEYADEALRRARETGDPVAEARAWTCLGALRSLQGRLEEAGVALKRAASLASDAKNREVEATALSRLSVCRLQGGRNQEARDAGLRSLHATREAGKPVPGVEAMLNLAAAQSRLGDTIAAEELQEQALELAASIGYRNGEAMAALELGNTRGQLGRGAEARRCFERALAIARETGEPALEARALGASGVSWLAAGRPAQAARCLESSRALRRELGDRVGAELVRVRLCHLAAECGQLEQEEANDAARSLAALEARAHEGLARFVLGRIAELAGDVGAARGHYADALAKRRASSERTALAEGLVALGRLELEAGRGAEARACLEEARALARASTLPNLAAVAEVWLARAPGGDVEAARAAFARQEMRISHLERIAANHALWSGGAGAAHLAEAQRLVEEFRDAAPEKWREGVVRVYRRILDAS